MAAPFRLELTLMLEADRIDLELCVANTGDAPLDFTGRCTPICA